MLMKKYLSIGVALAFIAVPLSITAPPADARARDNPNYGFCKSGNQVRDIKFCKENGGRK
jgi:hypothetical protein